MKGKGKKGRKPSGLGQATTPVTTHDMCVFFWGGGMYFWNLYFLGGSVFWQEGLSRTSSGIIPDNPDNPEHPVHPVQRSGPVHPVHPVQRSGL